MVYSATNSIRLQFIPVNLTLKEKYKKRSQEVVDRLRLNTTMREQKNLRNLSYLFVLIIVSIMLLNSTIIILVTF